MFDTPPFVDARDFAWSPDSRFIAYLTAGAKTFAERAHRARWRRACTAFKAGEGRAGELSGEHQRRLDGVEPGRHLPDVRHRRSAPSPATSSASICLPRTPKFREDQFRDLFKDEQPKTRPTAAASRATPATTRAGDLPAQPASTSGGVRPTARPVEIVFDDIRRRASVLPVGVDVCRQEISPDGKWLLLTASAAGQQNLYVYSDRRAVAASRRSRGS